MRQLAPSTWAVAGALSVAGASAALYVFAFIFISGSAPGKLGNSAQDKFIDQTCNGKSGLLPTVLTLGYCKATVRRFVASWKLLVWPQPQAMVGKPAPDAALVTLDGRQVQLSEYLSAVPPGMPLVLNMGSFT